MSETDDNTETIATYEQDGRRYQIDHLGIGYDNQYGAFAVYQDGRQVAEFDCDQFGVKPECRSWLPPNSELVAMAIAAVVAAGSGGKGKADA